MIEVLNLGAGVQSTTVLLMSIRGELPKLDHTIFADTGWEPAEVYRHLEWLKGECKEAAIELNIVQQGDLRKESVTGVIRGVKTEDGEHRSTLPYFTVENGTNGMLRRQCTNEYKIRPIEKYLRRDIMGLKPRQHAPKEPVIRQWRGISVDEWQRVRKADHKWYITYHPLVDMKITRDGCHAWLRRNGYPEAPRSACIGCPFHSNQEWRKLRDESPDEWQDAVEFDKAIRHAGGVRGDTFLHSQRVPLNKAVIDRDMPGQLMLWQNECEGMCGV